MATSLLTFKPNTHPIYPHLHIQSPNFKFHSPLAILNTKLINYSCASNLVALAPVSNSSTPTNGDNHENDVDFGIVLNKCLKFVHSALPGGTWWNFNQFQQVDSIASTAKQITVWDFLRRMWGLVVVDDKWLLFIAFGSLIIAALLEISIPNLLATSIFSAESGGTSVFFKNAYLLALLCITSGIFSGLRSGCFATVNMNLLRHLREALFSTLVFQDILFFDKETVGSLTSRLGPDCQRLSHVIGNDVHMILRYSIQGMGALINLLILSWPLALSALMICSLLSTIFLIYGQYRKEAAKITQDFTARSNDVSHETISLIRTVHTFGMERHETGRYKLWLDRLASISLRESAADGFWNLSFNSLYRFTQVFAILLGGMSIRTGHATPEQLTKYVLYCEWLIYAAWRVQNNISSLLKSTGACEKVLELMDLLPGNQFQAKGLKLKKLMGHVEFVNVSFYYPSRVGLSGSGKSTLVNLLLRLYEPSGGQILIDSIPLEGLDVRWLRGNIGYVGQEPHLFHMDIKGNIMYGCSKDIKHEDVERAAKEAFAHEFITALPDGYETIVDDELLSGGQKQRIAIARAILRDPAILILDEATSALDAESEYHIKDILQGLRNETKSRRTTIVIAHRLSTIRAAGRIAVMDGGRVIEMGDHSELLRQNGLYARLNELQRDALAV
ncbi:ABC transporter B family member 26, chloroplastic-like isoform X2 [Apium graveolens]|uniref:ABC transporter B family member 26, chloroplastic-like isoform X2 n=1 Tax=Apium graveolens TaxID=4045 RepID=UPI003D7BA08B